MTENSKKKNNQGLDPEKVQTDVYKDASDMIDIGSSIPREDSTNHVVNDLSSWNDPKVLLSILNDACIRHREDSSPNEVAYRSEKDFQNVSYSREDLEATWKAIRIRWLWAHETREERSQAAYQRLEKNGLAPLHLLCKLTSNPPTDILEEIVWAAPEVTSWEDNHNWLPLHHACSAGASTEVLKVLLEVFPLAKGALDFHNRTPLHLYATRGHADHYHPRTMATNFGLLCSPFSQLPERNGSSAIQTAAEIRDEEGMIPMHYACAYGTAKSVLRVLEEAYPQGIYLTDNRGRTPLHFVMVNAQRISSPGVLSFLLERDPESQRFLVNARDNQHNLPIHYLLTIPGLDSMFSSSLADEVENLSECLKVYLAAEPNASTDFLAALQALPDVLQDVAVVSPHVRRILNQKIIQRFPTSILMMDGMMLLTMIVCFEVATTAHIDQLLDVDGHHSHFDLPRACLYVTTAYFFLREVIQIVASLALGAFSSWMTDTTNWLDVSVIGLVAYYTIVMEMADNSSSTSSSTEASFRTGAALTKGVLWTAVIYFLKSTQVDFAVFLNGVFYVVQRLVAFLLAILVILISFAQMFWVVYLEHPVCTFSCPTEDQECASEMKACHAYPHCDFGDSFLKVYTMMMGEIGTETRYDQNLLAQILYILYGFFIVILLSNVLIAIVTDSYEIVQNDRAAIVFWSNRLDFVAEMDGIASVVRKRLCFWRTGKGLQTKNTSLETEEDKAQIRVYPRDEGNPLEWNGDHCDHEEQNIEDQENITKFKKGSPHQWFRHEWDSILSLFEHDVYGDASEDQDFWIDSFKKTLAMIVIPLWLILGFLTMGILWPPQVREWLFVQEDTVASRAEIEKWKLEELQDIQRETKSLRDEMKLELQNDRDEIFRTKADIDAVQEEVLADLHQVNVLVTTLLSDLGGLEG